MENEAKTYLLVIKRNNNDFLPIEWQYCDLYKGENLYTLEGIDSFTRRITSTELVLSIAKANLVDPKEKFQKFAIIYKVKNKTRELKEGAIFKEHDIIYSEDELIKFIIKNKDNKELINKIFNLINFKDAEEKIKEFKFVLKNLDLFAAKGPNGLKAALSTFKNISYEKKRTIILKITDNIIINLTEEDIRV